MASDIGSQTITVKYFDPVDSAVANRIGIDLRKVGIYSGGYLTRISDTSVSLSPFSIEISDGTYQINCKTGATVTPITVSSTNIYVVIRWAYTGNAADDYVSFVATASPLTNDVVVGKCNYTGSTLVGFDYTSRTNPNILDLILKVEPEETPSMYLRVRAGRVNYGSVGYDIVNQLSPLFSAPVSGSRIDLLQVNASGALIITTGVAGSSPVPPSYGGLVTLAQITLTSGQTSITATSIKDVRAYVGASSSVPQPITSGGTGQVTAVAALNALLPSQTGNANKVLTTDGTNANWDYPRYAP